MYTVELDDVFSKIKFVRLKTEVYRHLLAMDCGTVDTYNILYIIHAKLGQSLEKKSTYHRHNWRLSIYIIHIYE